MATVEAEANFLSKTSKLFYQPKLLRLSLSAHFLFASLLLRARNVWVKKYSVRCPIKRTYSSSDTLYFIPSWGWLIDTNHLPSGGPVAMMGIERLQTFFNQYPLTLIKSGKLLKHSYSLISEAGICIYFVKSALKHKLLKGWKRPMWWKHFCTTKNAKR